MNRDKPQGSSGPLVFGDGGVSWQVISFPENKAERECLIARLFAAASLIKEESQPSLAPFTDPQQNEENDLDFTVQTALGERLMELAEFAPLKEHGPTFAHAPTQLPQSTKFRLSRDLIARKSTHQGAAGRILVIYNTEQGFELDAVTIELLRRDCARSAPRFDRVYNLAPVSLNSASVTEVYPGKPHFYLGEIADDDLLAMVPIDTHPASMTAIQRPGSVHVVPSELAQIVAEAHGPDPDLTLGPIRRRPR